VRENLLEHDRFADAALRDELKRLNTHLPKNRRTLEDLLADPSPSVLSVSGHRIRMRRKELEELSASLTDDDRRRIRLPIVLIRRRDLGPGAFTVFGDPYEEYAILRLSGSVNGTFEDFKQETRETVTIYKPQISLLLRRLHSLIVVGFGATGLEE